MKATGTRFVFCLMIFLLGNIFPAIEHPIEVNAVFAQEAPQRQVNWIGWWQGVHGREQLVWQVADEFAFENPDVKVNLKFTAEIGLENEQETAKLIVDMIRSGEIRWDIVWLNTRTYLLVADELNDPEWGPKHLVNFLEVDGFSETQKDFIIEDLGYRQGTGGILVGPYIEGFHIMAWYNQDLAAMMGLDIRQHGMTFHDFLGYVKRISEYNTQHNPDIAAICDSNLDWVMTEYLFRSLFKSEFIDLTKAEEEVFTEQKREALQKTLQAFEQLGQYRPLIKGHNEYAWFETRHFPLEDKCVFYFNGSWMYSHWMSIDETKTSKMIPAELPVFQEAEHYIGGFIPTFAVMKNSPHREDAIKLLMYWSQPKIAEKWVEYTKTPTGLKGNLSTADLADDRVEQFQAEIGKKYGGNIHLWSDSMGYVFGPHVALRTFILNPLIHLLDGEMTAQEAYEALLKEARIE